MLSAYHSCSDDSKRDKEFERYAIRSSMYVYIRIVMKLVPNNVISDICIIT